MGGRTLVQLLLVLVAACPARSAGPARGTSAATSSANASGTQHSASSATAATAAAPASPAVAPASTTTLAEVGIEAASLDRSVDPCVDFYQFACGGWLRAHAIPADRGRWSRHDELEQAAAVALRTIIDEQARAGRPAGDYFASCMADDDTRERSARPAVSSLLARTQKLATAKAWMAAVAELHRHGIWVVWSADARGPGHAIVLEAARFGLPDESYYARAELAGVLDGYREHVGRVLALGGVAKTAAAAAADVVAIERELARLARESQAGRQATDVKTLGKQVRIDWKAYFKALGVTPAMTTRLAVGAPRYFAALEGVRTRFKPAQWASYFAYHVLASSAFARGGAFDDEMFELTRLVTGATEPTSRERRCVAATAEAFAELATRHEERLAPGTRDAAGAMVTALARAMAEQLKDAAWLGTGARRAAQQAPDTHVLVAARTPAPAGELAVKRDDFAGNLLRARVAATRHRLAGSGTAHGAGTAPLAGGLVIDAAILQPPVFATNRSVAANLGGLALSAGHELMNAVADHDRAGFAERGRCLAEQYSTFEALPAQFVDGTRTLATSLADLGGVKAAFVAYKSLRGSDLPVVADGLTEDQQFFIAVAQAACTKYRKPALQHVLHATPHAPASFRVYGALRNLPELAAAFSCSAGTPMRPAQTCSVW